MRNLHRKRSQQNNEGKGMKPQQVLCNMSDITGHYFYTRFSFLAGVSSRINTKLSNAYSIARGGHLVDEGVACGITLSDIEEATKNFSKKIGKGSFGPVYYGKMKDGKEVAVKIMADSSSHGTKQFFTEVMLDLSL